ncbi:MAG: PH domain-containing protein [Candidatus Daviesbacteria bacterium]|nr:PH domain-containing protein [Candidatus Daviesbacteria bacterium]
MTKFHYRESPTPGQKKAFSSYLSEDEELVLVASLSGAYLRNKFFTYLFFPGIIFGLVIAGLGFILGVSQTSIIIMAGITMLLAAFLKTLHQYHANRYLLTTKRVMIKKGLFGVKLTAALYDKITHIEVDQSLLDRLLLHHGNILINTAGANKSDFIMKYVDYPMELKNLLERLINREREQAGTGVRTVSAVEGEIIS